MDPARKILIFRLGSIGDFVISLPCFHLVRERYPKAEIALLTNEPGDQRVVPAESVLQGTGFVDRYIKYPPGTRDLHELGLLKSDIRSFAPDILINLAAFRGIVTAYRDYVFFQWCGVRRIVGPPTSQRWAEHRPPDAGSDLWEPEAQRLGRRLAGIGKIDFTSERNWDLHLSGGEIDEAARILDEGIPACKTGSGQRRLGLSVGTKQPINDWGDANWHLVLQGLRMLDCGLVLFGGMEDRLRSQRLAENWPGPVMNLCGKISPRVSAAMLRHVDLLLCHDSGPMHLAAAAGTRCVAVFSRKNPPGKWFPFGSGHQILYPTSKSGTIQAIRPRQVIAAAVDVLGTPQRSSVSLTLQRAE